jgi:hypothetical protein
VSGGFGSLYYTDCRPGQGLQSGAGFQFQAASPGVSTEAMPLVQRTALYEPPVRWMRERRPVTDYPPSLAHTADGGLFVTAAGRYLGQEANGTRDGNQFTHAVVTRDPADYGVVRPAQLWGAPWWAVEPAPGTELDELTNPEAGPLDVETVCDRVRDTAGGQGRLTALLSAIHHLQDPAHRRTVVLVSADPEQAACWIAAATLLLPGPDALRVSFKIFVADGQYGQHDIIALHPEWAGRWADTTAGSGLAVFDLDQGCHTDVEVTAAACFWVPRLLAEDPYDVVDAIERAGQFARARAAGRVDDALEGTDALVQPTGDDRLAAVVIELKERLTAPHQVQQAIDWLLTAPGEAMEIAREPVLGAVLEAAPGAPELRKLAAVGGPRGWASAAAQIRRRLLTAEISEALAESDGVAGLRNLTALPPLPPLELPDQDQSRAAVEAALRGARPDQVPALLTVAHRHALRPVTGNFRSTAHGFAAWWVQRPDPALEPENWPAPPEALDWVRDVLRGWLAGPRHAHAVAAVRARWWRPLWRQACDPTDALDAELIAVACQHLKGSQRDQLILDAQDWAFARTVGEADPSIVAWNTVFGVRRPEMSEAATFLVGLVDSGRTVGPEMGSQLCAVLEAQPTLSEQALWTVDQLGRYGHPLPQRLAGLRMGDDAVHHVGDKLGQEFEVRVPIVLAAPRDAAVAFLGSCSDEFAIPIHQALTLRWPSHVNTATADECRAVAFTFVLAAGRPRTEQQGAAFTGLLDRLAALVAAMPPDVRTAVERSYPGGLGQQWWDWVSTVEPRRWSLRRRSGPGSVKKPEKRGG